jgi:uncharacterized membrane protein
MATLSTLIFSNVDGASAAKADFRLLGGVRLLALRDASTMAWHPGDRLPALRHADELQLREPVGPGFWHLLFTHLFILPVAAAEAGLPTLSPTSSLAGLGIRDDFLQTAQRRLGPGTSALFVLTDDANVDPVIDLLADLPFTVTSTNLSTRQLETLCTAFRPDTPGGSDEHPSTLRAADMSGGP